MVVEYQHKARRCGALHSAGLALSGNICILDMLVSAIGGSTMTKLERDSRKALRDAWPHRHTSFRAPHVIRANVAMLRRLRDA